MTSGQDQHFGSISLVNPSNTEPASGSAQAVDLK